MNKDQSSPRAYRQRVRSGGWVSFSVRVEQTDLFLRAQEDLTSAAYDLAVEARGQILSWAAKRPEFLSSLAPLPLDPAAPVVVRRMLEAGRVAGVGPMAAVAGAIAEHVGRGLLPLSPAGVIVENGGDLFLVSTQEVTVGLFAGDSPLSLKLGLRLLPEQTPLGVCTSSGTFGHSLSLGRADAATVLAPDAALADAAATALGNRLKKAGDLKPALEWILSLEGIKGAAAVVDGRLGFLGDLELVPL
ncbi:MAG: UPF0280 family protein [Thermodesulfobacteriota bacterium]